MSTSTQWLVQIKQICTQVGIQHVDLLLDQTAWHNYALPGLRKINPTVPWFSLFSGTPEGNMLDHAPLLMRLDFALWQHEAWLEELITHCATDARLLVLVSALDFEALAHALRALLQFNWGGCPGLLRYYDPRIFPLLMSSILTDEQRDKYLEVTCYWGWLDRDEQPQWLEGKCQSKLGGIAFRPALDLSDQQCELIGAISDAQELLNNGVLDDFDGSQERRFTLLYSYAVQACQENYFGRLSEYVKRKI